jgi:hypothetical protein
VIVSGGLCINPILEAYAYKPLTARHFPVPLARINAISAEPAIFPANG